MFRKATPREGDLYKTIRVGERSYTILYGYYSHQERLTEEPIPIFPDLAVNPEYTTEGRPIVTRIQDPCAYYQCRGSEPDGWCADCIYYPNEKEEIGICQCAQNRYHTKEETR